jgi:hypothetical protein
MTPEEALVFVTRVRENNRIRQSKYYQTNKETVRQRAKEYYQTRKTKQSQDTPSNTPASTNTTA